MQRINRNRMGPSFPRAPPARLPMMDFRAKPGFDQKYNILPDISGIRKEMEEDFQNYQHEEQFTHSWQSPAVSIENPLYMGGSKGQKNNDLEMRMPLNREPAHLIDGFYNEPNDFHPGIQRTLTQNHNIQPRPRDSFLTTKSDAIFNARIDRTFITPNVDKSLYGTKNILPGISKKEKTSVKAIDKAESDGFMKRVMSSHALNVHLPRDKDPLVKIKPKDMVEKSNHFNEYGREKQGRINIVPERFAEIMKEEIQNNIDSGHVVSTDVHPKYIEFEETISGHNERESTGCISFESGDMAFSGYVDDAIKVDRIKKLGIESIDEENKSLSYEATEVEEDDASEKIDDAYADDVRRGYCPGESIIRQDAVKCTSHEVEIKYQVCDEEESVNAGSFADCLKPHRSAKLGVESSSESNKSLSYEENGLEENVDDSNDDNAESRTYQDMITDHRDDMASINHEVEVGFEICDKEESASIVDLGGSIKQERVEKLGIESSNESNQSCSYETTEVAESDTEKMENLACVGNIRRMTCPEIITVRRDGMRCVNHEVDIEYEISADEESHETEIQETSRTVKLDDNIINDPEIERKLKSLNSTNVISKDYARQNVTNDKEKLIDLKDDRAVDDSCKVDLRDQNGFESSNKSNQSSRDEAREIEDFEIRQENSESSDGSIIKPEVFTVRRDGMKCVNHATEIEYETEEDAESCESKSKSDSNEFESLRSRHCAKNKIDTPNNTFPKDTLDKDKYIEDHILQNESSAVLGHVDCKKVNFVENRIPENGKENRETTTPRDETDTVDTEHSSQLNSNENGEKESQLSPGKYYAIRTKAQITQELDCEHFENDTKNPLNVQDITPAANSCTEIENDARICYRDLSTGCVNMVRNDSMKCVAYETEPGRVEEYTGSKSKCFSGLGGNNDKVSGKTAYQSIDIISLGKPVDCSTLSIGKENKESAEINVSRKDNKSRRDVREDEKKSLISRIFDSNSEKTKDYSLHDNDEVKDNSVKDTVNVTNSEKSSKDSNTTISKKSSKRVITVEPETVKRERRKRKWERDKINKLSQPAAKTGGQRERVKRSTSPIDSNPKALDSNTGQITYETDDDIDNISDKILDQSSGRYDENTKESNIRKLEIKSVKRVTFDDEPRVYNMKSVSSSTGSSFTLNRNDEDSTDHDTVYDTDEDIDEISNDILDEFNDEKQDISKTNFEDKTFEIIYDKQNSIRNNAVGQNFVTIKGDNVETSHDLPRGLIDLPNVSKDDLAEECKDGKVMKVVDDMKLKMGNGICEKKRCHSFDLRNIKREINDRHATERTVDRATSGSQKLKRDNQKQVQRHDCDNLDSNEDIRGVAVMKKSIVATGDSNAVTSLSVPVEEKDSGMKLLIISRNADENRTKQPLRTTTIQTEKAENYGVKPQENCLFDHYASGAHRSELYKRIMSILEIKVGRERASTLMKSASITDMVENLSKNPEKYGKHYADLLELREERTYLDLTQYISDPSKVENENRPWCYYERLKIFSVSSDSKQEHGDFDDYSDSDAIQSNNEIQSDFNRNSDKTDKVIDETKNTKDKSETRQRRRFSFKSFLRKFIFVCKSKVDHEDI